MKTALLIITFTIGFFIGQIFFHPAFYRMYKDLAEHMKTVGEKKEVVIIAEDYRR